MFWISSSVKSSPRSCATFFNSRVVNFPALLISNDWNTLSTSALLSLSLSLAVASLKNSAKSIPPDWSSSNSAKIWYTNLFCPPNPRLSKALFNYWGSTTPLRSPSKISKAILMSLTSSTGIVRDAKSSALHSFFYAALGCCLTWEAGFGGIWNISK